MIDRYALARPLANCLAMIGVMFFGLFVVMFVAAGEVSSGLVLSPLLTLPALVMLKKKPRKRQSEQEVES